MGIDLLDITRYRHGFLKKKKKKKHTNREAFRYSRIKREITLVNNNTRFLHTKIQEIDHTLKSSTTGDIYKEIQSNNSEKA